MTDIVERLRWYTIADLEKLTPEAVDEVERLRVDLDQQTLRATAEAEAAARLRSELERLRAELAAAKALLREVLATTYYDGSPLATRIRAALGDEPASPRSDD